MQRPTHAWSRFNNSGTASRLAQPPAPVQQSYDHDEADSNGWSPQQGNLYNGWMMAEACKVKDALFIGNLMAVQVCLAEPPHALHPIPNTPPTKRVCCRFSKLCVSMGHSICPV